MSASSGRRPSRHLSRLMLALGLLTAAPVVLAAASGNNVAAALSAATQKMYRDMTAVHGSDTDRAFAQMMIPHHQGAVDMAKIEMAHGRDPRLRHMAQDMITHQQQQIGMMRGILVDLDREPAPN